MLQPELSWGHLIGKYLVRESGLGKEIIFVKKANKHTIDGTILTVKSHNFREGLWDMDAEVNQEAKIASLLDENLYLALFQFYHQKG
jgi:hypothetical protein